MAECERSEWSRVILDDRHSTTFKVRAAEMEENQLHTTAALRNRIWLSLLFSAIRTGHLTRFCWIQSHQTHRGYRPTSLFIFFFFSLTFSFSVWPRRLSRHCGSPQHPQLRPRPSFQCDSSFSHVTDSIPTCDTKPSSTTTHTQKDDLIGSILSSIYFFVGGGTISRRSNLLGPFSSKSLDKRRDYIGRNNHLKIRPLFGLTKDNLE